MEWQKVIENIADLKDKLSEVRPITLIVNAIRICLGLHQGIFYAIEDTCPHQEASLGKGKTLVSGGVECPFHHYVFDLKTGKCRVGACRSLQTFDLKIEGTSLWIKC
jgi:3-phenylpropionate/trans-cinnamate dioxygenase ferredoxin subunit